MDFDGVSKLNDERKKIVVEIENRNHFRPDSTCVLVFFGIKNKDGDDEKSLKKNSINLTLDDCLRLGEKQHDSGRHADTQNTRVCLNHIQSENAVKEKIDFVLIVVRETEMSNSDE